jgi:hypothetical protein
MPSELGLYANPESTGVQMSMYVNKNAESIAQIVPGDDLSNLGAIGTQPTQALQTVNGLPAGPLLDGQNNNGPPVSNGGAGGDKGIGGWFKKIFNQAGIADHNSAELGETGDGPTNLYSPETQANQTFDP